jgi:hypothetical protein
MMTAAIFQIKVSYQNSAHRSIRRYSFSAWQCWSVGLFRPRLPGWCWQLSIRKAHGAEHSLPQSLTTISGCSIRNLYSAPTPRLDQGGIRSH